MKTKSIFALLLVIILVTACAQASPTVVVPTSGPVVGTPTSAYPPPKPVTTPTNSGAYPGPTTNPTAVNPSPAQQAAIQLVSKKYNLTVDQIKVISIEEVTWPNGCLGVVIPGVMCTDVIVYGFNVKLEANGQQFEIHTNENGSSAIDAAQQLATLGFVVLTPADAIQVINPNIPLGPTYNPAFNGFLPLGGSILGTAYIYVPSQSKVVALDASGQRDLTFIKAPTYGLAIWRGGQGAQPLLAWGTQLYPENSSSLVIANPDGSNLETLLTIKVDTAAPVQLIAELWSADGQSLYFSKEPVGIGGYILFGGASNLYKIDIATKQVTEVIAQTPSTSPQICLDAISGDYRFVADHCTQNVITIRDLQAGTTTSIQVQSGFSGYGVIGSARFSPSGDRVAFVLAKHDPNDEQGWVAIGKSSGGTSNLILTGDKGSYYNILGWLDDQTLLIQSYAVGGTNPINQVFTLSADGTTLTKVTDGTLLTVIDNR